MGQSLTPFLGLNPPPPKKKMIIFFLGLLCSSFEAQEEDDEGAGEAVVRTVHTSDRGRRGE